MSFMRVNSIICAESKFEIRIDLIRPSACALAKARQAPNVSP